MKKAAKKKAPKTKRAPAPVTPKRSNAAADLLSIAAALKDHAAKWDPGPTWRDKVIVAMTGPDDRAAIIQAAQIERDAGVLEADSCFYILDRFANDAADDRREDDAELNRIGQEIAAAEKAHGLKEDEYFDDDEMPDDIEQMEIALLRRTDAILAAILREYGEDDMADLLLNDRDAYLDRVYSGRDKFAGPLPQDIADKLAAARKAEKARKAARDTRSSK